MSYPSQTLPGRLTCLIKNGLLSKMNRIVETTCQHGRDASPAVLRGWEQVFGLVYGAGFGPVPSDFKGEPAASRTDEALIASRPLLHPDLDRNTIIGQRLEALELIRNTACRQESWTGMDTRVFEARTQMELDDLLTHFPPSKPRCKIELNLREFESIPNLTDPRMLYVTTLRITFSTSRRWTDSPAASLPSVTELHLAMPGPLSIRCFSAFTNLQHLTVTIPDGYASPPLPDFKFPASLTSLTIRGRYYSTYFTAMSGLDRLDRLILERDSLFNRELALIPNLASLTYLCIQYAMDDDETFVSTILAGCPNLNRMDLGSCPRTLTVPGGFVRIPALWYSIQRSGTSPSAFQPEIMCLGRYAYWSVNLQACPKN